MSMRTAILFAPIILVASVHAQQADFFDIPIPGSRRVSIAKPPRTPPPAPAAELPEVSAGMLKELQVYEDTIGEIVAETIDELRENLVGKLKQHQAAAQREANLEAAVTMGNWIDYFEGRGAPAAPEENGEAGTATKIDYRSGLPEATGELIKKFYQLEEESKDEAESAIRKKRESTAQDLFVKVKELTELGDIAGAIGTRQAARELLKSDETASRPDTRSAVEMDEVNG